VVFVDAREAVEDAFYRPHYRIQPGALTAENASDERAERLGDEEDNQ
jgi:hypothetical protein